MPFEANLFVELSVLFGIATLVAILMRFLRQPLIIGHIITGLLVGPFVFNILRSFETLRLFSEIGVAFLLFTVGLGLNPHVLRDFGKVALITGLGQVFFTTIAGYFVSTWLGFGNTSSIYMGIALSFSSTIIILKLISDKGDLEKLYAKISIGFLLVQDIVAIILLLVIPMISEGNLSPESLVYLLVRGVIVTLVLLVFVRYLLSGLYIKLSNNSGELLFLFAIAWGMVISSVFWKSGFALESGALIAGVLLSTFPAKHEIAARLTPLRDFFIVIFFILLGSQVSLGYLSALLYPAIILSLLVFVANPLILMVIMGVLGYRRKTAFETALNVAQVSEFSFILIALGVSLGHLEQEVLSLVTLVGLITIFGSTYLVLYSEKIYHLLDPHLKFFERRIAVEPDMYREDYDVYLFGGGRVGFEFVEFFQRLKRKFLVVEHDPEVISNLKKSGVSVEYGDAHDLDFLVDLKIRRAELVVSTIPDLETNIIILREARRENPKVLVMAVSHSISNAIKLYEIGVDYVILPHFLGAKLAADIAEKYAKDIDALGKLREEHRASLSKHIALGHEHPALESLR